MIDFLDPTLEPGSLDHLQNLFHGTQLLKALLLTLLGWGGGILKTSIFCWDRLGPESLGCNACTWLKVYETRMIGLLSISVDWEGKFWLALISPSYYPISLQIPRIVITNNCILFRLTSSLVIIFVKNLHGNNFSLQNTLRMRNSTYNTLVPFIQIYPII